MRIAFRTESIAVLRLAETPHYSRVSLGTSFAPGRGRRCATRAASSVPPLIRRWCVRRRTLRKRARSPYRCSSEHPSEGRSCGSERSWSFRTSGKADSEYPRPGEGRWTQPHPFWGGADSTIFTAELEAIIASWASAVPVLEGFGGLSRCGDP